jgi:NAD(P)-dependent dehydrogenase (short-subunit alcohol dehydrogenase family)
MQFEGKIVFVTGSARRVGRAIALAFAEQGANLVLHHASPGSAVDAQSAADEVRKLGGDAIVISGNQANSAEVAQMFEQICAHYGKLDVMVNSAAIFKRADFLDISEAEWDLVMSINLKGPFLLTQHAARLMKENDGGVIINISDNSGFKRMGIASTSQHQQSRCHYAHTGQRSIAGGAQHPCQLRCAGSGTGPGRRR